MAFASINEFPNKDIEIAAVFKALSHPGRVAILKVLAKKQSCICGDLVADLPLAQSTVSQHLKVLKEAGLVQGEIDGPRSCYCINKETIKKLKKQCGDLFDFIDKHSEAVQSC
jgi:ArsR family transcriptional regulator